MGTKIGIENFTGRILFTSMFNDISRGSKDNEKECLAMLDSFLCTQRDLEKDNGHSLVLALKRRGIISVKTGHKEYGTIWLKGCCWNSKKVDVQFSVRQVHCPEVDSKAKVMENCRFTLLPLREQLRLFFA